MDRLLYRFFKKEVPLKFVDFKRGKGKPGSLALLRQKKERWEGKMPPRAQTPLYKSMMASSSEANRKW